MKDKATFGVSAGILTISVLGSSISVSAGQAGEWLKVVTDNLPLLICLFLLYQYSTLREAHRNCEKNVTVMRTRLRRCYRIMMIDDPVTRKTLAAQSLQDEDKDDDNSDDDLLKALAAAAKKDAQ